LAAITVRDHGMSAVTSNLKADWHQQNNSEKTHVKFRSYYSESKPNEKQFGWTTLVGCRQEFKGRRIGPTLRKTLHKVKMSSLSFTCL